MTIVDEIFSEFRDLLEGNQFSKEDYAKQKKAFNKRLREQRNHEAKMRNEKLSKAIQTINAIKILNDSPRVDDLLEDVNEILVEVRK